MKVVYESLVPFYGQRQKYDGGKRNTKELEQTHFQWRFLLHQLQI
jgi:hypothetical protein